jgi:hypothetical protein
MNELERRTQSLLGRIQLALLAAEPDEAASLLSRLLRDPQLPTQSNHEAWMLARALSDLRERWPESLEFESGRHVLASLALSPLFGPHRVH